MKIDSNLMKKILILVAMIFCICFTAFGDGNGVGEDSCLVATVDGDNLNVRSFEGLIVGKLKNGTAVLRISETSDGRAKVGQQRNGKMVVLGWVALDFLNCPETGNQTPTAKNYLITEYSAGDIRLGTTISQARKILAGAKFSRDMDGGEGVIISVDQGGKSIMWLTSDRSGIDDTTPILPNEKIESIQIWDSRYKTADGVHPGMEISEVEKRFGKVKEIQLWGLDDSEHPTFSNQPKNYRFTATPRGGFRENVRAGIYQGDETSTVRYGRGAVIDSIQIMVPSEEQLDNQPEELKVGNISADYSGCSCVAQSLSESQKEQGKFLFYADLESSETSGWFNINGHDTTFKLVKKGKRLVRDRIGSRFSDEYEAGGIRIVVEYVTSKIQTESADYDMILTFTKGDQRVIEKAVGSCGC